MKTTTLIKKLNQKEELYELGTDFANKYAICKVKEVSGLFQQFSKQLDIILGIK